MRGRTRQPTPLELALWHQAVREVVRLAERSASFGRSPGLPGAAPPEPAAPSPPEPVEEGATAGPAGLAKRTPPSTARLPRPAPLDRRTLRRLERGRFPISTRLDLHGLDQEAAHAALVTFLAQARARGHRCVLVITGRGERSGGVLRRAVPRWLQEPDLAACVLGFAEAGRAHGGEGALYVLLRRPPETGTDGGPRLPLARPRR